MTILRVADPEAEAWKAQAACADHPADLWFPVKGDNRAVTAAKAICAGCPVRRECLEYALVNHEQHGIWGGLTTRQRRPATVGPCHWCRRLFVRASRSMKYCSPGCREAGARAVNRRYSQRVRSVR